MANNHTTLTALFTAIANAIRSKTGKSAEIVADNFPSAISGIVTPVLQSKTVSPSTSPQTIKPDTGYNGLSAVTVSAVPTETKSVTANGTYTPSSGKFFSSVSVAIPTYDGGVS